MNRRIGHIAISLRPPDSRLMSDAHDSAEIRRAAASTEQKSWPGAGGGRDANPQAD